MNNDEIRYKILRVLYDRYYNGQYFEYVPPDEVISKSGLETEDQNVVTANVDYLARRHYVEGIRDFSKNYPTNVKLKVLGINYVEDRDSELLGFHNKIRFRILSELYQRHFGGELGHDIPADQNFIECLKLDKINNEIIYGDLTYLEHSNFIQGEYELGLARPFEVKIDTFGIDTVENILNHSIEELETSDIDAQIKTEVENIKNERDKKSKVRKFGEFISKHEGSVTKIAIEIIKAVINSGISGA